MPMMSDATNNSSNNDNRIKGYRISDENPILYFTPVSVADAPNKFADLGEVVPWLSYTNIMVNFSQKLANGKKWTNGKDVQSFVDFPAIDKKNSFTYGLPSEEFETPYEFFMRNKDASWFESNDFTALGKFDKKRFSSKNKIVMLAYIAEDGFNAGNIKNIKHENLKLGYIQFSPSASAKYQKALEDSKSVVTSMGGNFHPSSFLYSLSYGNKSIANDYYSVQTVPFGRTWDYKGAEAFIVPEDFDWDKVLYNVTYKSQITYLKKLGVFEYLEANNIDHKMFIDFEDDPVDSPI